LRAASRLPQRASGPIHQLQGIRRRQERDALRVLEHTKVPAGMAFDYLGFVLVELFPIEESRQLANGIQQLFGLDPEADVLSRIREYAAKPDETGWQQVGILYRNQKPLLAPHFGFRQVPDLPEAIEYVDIHVTRLSESTLTMHAVAYAAPAFNEQISHIINSPILAAVELNDFRPRFIGYSLTSYSANIAKAEKARAFFRGVRAETTRVVFGRYFRCGYLARGRGCDTLSTIDVYQFSGLPRNEPSVWLETTRGWRFGLGLDIEHAYFAKNDFAFGFVSASPDEPLVWPLFTTEVIAARTGDPGAARRERMSALSGQLRGSAYLLAVHAYSHSVTRKMARFRENVYSGRSVFGITHDASLYEDILKERLLVNRLHKDIGRLNEKTLDDHFLTSLRFYDNPIAGIGAAESLIREAQRNYARLKGDMDSIIDYFSSVVSARNIRTTFLVATFALIVAALALVAPIASQLLENRQSSTDTAHVGVSTQFKGVIPRQEEP